VQLPKFTPTLAVYFILWYTSYIKIWHGGMWLIKASSDVALVWFGTVWQGQCMQKKPENKVKTSFTLLPKIKTLIVILSEKFGISQTAVVQMAIVKMAESENVDVNEDDEAG
jgi:hypothetical protein